MGSLTVDLGGDWPGDDVADLTIDNSMGELRLQVPDTVRIASDSDVSNLLGGERRHPRRRGGGWGGAAPQAAPDEIRWARPRIRR